jgi:hypothetical protein
MNYRLIPVHDVDNNGVINSTDREAIIGPIVNGDQTVSGVLRSDPCIFTQDFTPEEEGVSLPDLDVTGTPGQMGFGVSIQIPSPLPQQQAPARPDCLEPSEIQVEIGSRSEALAIGGWTRKTNARVRFVNGPRFDDSRYFRGRVTHLSSSNRATGEFEFINELSGSNTLLLANGSFAIE